MIFRYYPVTLSAGTANFEISVTNTTSQPGMMPLADRNIDAIVLTTNLSDIKMRALNEQVQEHVGTRYWPFFLALTGVSRP